MVAGGLLNMNRSGHEEALGQGPVGEPAGISFCSSRYCCEADQTRHLGAPWVPDM